MKKIIFVFALLFSFCFISLSSIQVMAFPEDNHVAVCDEAHAHNSIPTFYANDLNSPIYRGCPNCGARIFMATPYDGGGTLNLCFCGYEFIVLPRPIF